MLKKKIFGVCLVIRKNHNKSSKKILIKFSNSLDDNRWETVTRTSNGPIQDFTVSYQSLLPSTAYKFRVISYNKYGISYPVYSTDAILTPSKLYLEYGYLQYRPFYRQTWFMVALAASSVVVIIMVIAFLCVKSKSYKYKREFISIKFDLIFFLK